MVTLLAATGCVDCADWVVGGVSAAVSLRTATQAPTTTSAGTAVTWLVKVVVEV
jgi:hypothetical protein